MNSLNDPLINQLITILKQSILKKNEFLKEINSIFEQANKKYIFIYIYNSLEIYNLYNIVIIIVNYNFRNKLYYSQLKMLN